jgi:hypothetical protein
MPATILRRRFASPFVVTLAACTPSHTSNPPGPRPQPTPPTDPTPAQPDPVAEPPPAPATDPATPAREPAKFESRWTVMMQGTDCNAFHDSSCPKVAPGQPIPPCNPPPPIKYACPDGFKQGEALKIILRAGATDCFVDYPAMNCPPKAACNPPPPRKVACPQ